MLWNVSHIISLLVSRDIGVSHSTQWKSQIPNQGLQGFTDLTVLHTSLPIHSSGNAPGWFLSTTNWHLPYTSTRIKSSAALAADFHYLLKEVQGGEQKGSILCLRITGRTGVRIVGYFQELILWAQFLYLLVSVKALILLGGDCSLWLAEICKIMCLIVCTPPSPKSHIYWPSPTASLEQFLRAIWGAVSWAIVLILPQTLKLCFVCLFLKLTLSNKELC